MSIEAGGMEREQMSTDTRVLRYERDDRTSTVAIDGRRFPAATVVCPPVEGDESPDLDRALGTRATGGGDLSLYIPAENGVLFEINDVPEWPGLTLSLRARTCHLYIDPNDGTQMWLPQWAYLRDGYITTVDDGGAWHWDKADPDWVAETILRLSHKPYMQLVPSGPEVRLVPIDHFGEPND